jgi:hypothetical protein
MNKIEHEIILDARQVAKHIAQYSSVKENCRRGTARIKLSLEEKILDAVPLQCISFEPN